MNYTSSIMELEKNIESLPMSFIGVGEVKGVRFSFYKSNQCVSIYERSDGHIEVFERKNTAKCIDFEKKLFSETEFKEVYPKSRDFGKTAFTFSKYNDANEKFKELTKKIRDSK